MLISSYFLLQTRAMVRNKDQATVTISLSKDLLKQIDQRRAELEMDRSTYFRLLAVREVRPGYGTAKKDHKGKNGGDRG